MNSSNIAEASAANADNKVEAVRLVIWDLDDTFWQGTLSEGGIYPLQENIKLVKELAARGIVSSICSKNHFDQAKTVLMDLGVWDFFVFPEIEFAPKGAMVKRIVENVQLRVATILFVDDNHLNLNEVSHYNPGIQVANANELEKLNIDWRLKGKPDPNCERLGRYKILEQKNKNQKNSGGDNEEFLRQSLVRISFHHDIAENFSRIHELVNRSNQLNFTKSRWPEDEKSALQNFKVELEEVFDTHVGYIKVSDRYGSYGICGFYLTQHTLNKTARHFLFSCRAMNMGVEQFVWDKIGRPSVKIVGEVISVLDETQIPDWISIVEDADQVEIVDKGDAATKVLCVRGACDLSMSTHYLRMKYSVIEEFPYPYQSWGIHPVARNVVLSEWTNHGAFKNLLTHIPGIPENHFKSAINDGCADIYVLSFISEIFGAIYRSKSTGLFLHFHNGSIPQKDFRKVSYEEIQKNWHDQTYFSAYNWEFMKLEFEYMGDRPEGLFAADLLEIFQKLKDKKVIVLKLNENFGADWLLNALRRLNEIVLPLAKLFDFKIVDINEFVLSRSDLANEKDPGGHYSKDVYRKIAKRIEQICSEF